MLTRTNIAGGGRRAAIIASFAALLFGTGCPSFEDELTGRYLQVIEAGTEIGEREPAYAIDFFRFGNAAQAVVRNFDPSKRNTRESPFSDETSCVWTKSASFDSEDGTFDLYIEASTRNPETVVKGRVDDTGLLEVRVDRGEDFVDLVLERDEAHPPATRCDAVRDRPMSIEFPSDPGLPESSDHTITNPVFALVWVGVEPFELDGTLQYFPINSQSQAVRLASSNVIRKGKTLQGSVAVSVPPPEDKVLVRSGSTRFALAHPVVIDDEEDSGRFNWQTTVEPVIASALRAGVREGGPSDANGFGKALLFVEGRLTELAPDLRRRIRVVDEEGVATSLDDVDNQQELERDEAHFFVVDIDYYNESVLRLDLPVELDLVPMRVRVTDSFVSANRNLLPRVFGLGGF